MISNSSKGAVRNSGWPATERHVIGGSYRRRLTLGPSRKPVISAKDRSRSAEGAGAPDVRPCGPRGMAAAARREPGAGGRGRRLTTMLVRLRR
jgi:hypothetical protein